MQLVLTRYIHSGNISWCYSFEKDACAASAGTLSNWADARLAGAMAEYFERIHGVALPNCRSTPYRCSFQAGVIFRPPHALRMVVLPFMDGYCVYWETLERDDTWFVRALCLERVGALTNEGEHYVLASGLLLEDLVQRTLMTKELYVWLENDSRHCSPQGVTAEGRYGALHRCAVHFGEKLVDEEADASVDVLSLVRGGRPPGGGIRWVESGGSWLATFGVSDAVEPEEYEKKVFLCWSHLRRLFDESIESPRELPLVRPVGLPWQGSLSGDLLRAILQYCGPDTAARLVRASPYLARTLWSDLAETGISRLRVLVHDAELGYEEVSVGIRIKYGEGLKVIVWCQPSELEYRSKRQAYWCAPAQIGGIFACYLRFEGIALAYLRQLGLPVAE